MVKPGSHLGSLLIFGGLALAAVEAAAYVPARTDGGAALRWWQTSCVALRVDAAGSDDVDDGSDLQAVRRAVDNWARATAGCSYLRLELLPALPGLEAGYDRGGANENVVTWIERDWPFGAEQVALTIVFKKDSGPEAGRIVDADIVLNGAGFHFTTSGEAGRRDIESSLTHELGHLLGLDHTCVRAGTPSPWPRDHLDAEIPRCSEASAAVRATTLYPSASAEETGKRSPEADDVLGVCSTYPLAADPGRCAGDDPPVDQGGEAGGCSCRAGGGPAPWLSLSIALVALVVLRRARPR